MSREDRSRFNFGDDKEPSVGHTFRQEATELGVAAVRRISDSIQQRIVFQKGLNLVAVIPPEKGMIGGRIVVPPDEIHVVTGGGGTIFRLTNGYKVYGQAYVDALKAEGKNASAIETVYWRNKMSVIRALKTTAFTVTLENMEVLDSGYVKYFADVHMIAELDASDPLLAASKIGSMEELLGNIEQVAASELTTAAAKFALIEVIKDRSILGGATEAGVKEALKSIGYTLNTLRIGELRGEAVEKLVQQSTAVVTKDATIEINKAELVTLGDNRARERKEAELKATTDQATTAQRLTAEQANEIAATDKEEQVAGRQHTLTLANKAREQQEAEAKNKLDMRQVELDRERLVAQTQADAAKALEEQTLAKDRELKAAQDDAARQDLVQTRDLARAAEKTTQDVERLLQEKQAEAKRLAVVQTTQATATADALQIKTKAETDAELLQAGTKAQAAEKTALADVKLAEATRAKERAVGLAAADVRERELANETKEVEVERDRGLAQAAVSKEQADAEIHRQAGLLKVELDRATKQAELFAQNPALVELEMLNLRQAHALAMRQAELAAQVEIAKVMAPQMHVKLNLIGDGGRVSQAMAQFMAIAKGAQVVGEEVPLVGQLLGTNGHSSEASSVDLMSKIQLILPSVKQVLSSLEPTVWSTMKVSDLFDRMVPVLSGQKQVLQALQEIREDGNFRLVSNMDLGALLSLLGLTPDKASNGAAEMAAA